MSVEKREVYSVRIQRGSTRLPNGRYEIDWDGYRFICKFHNDLIKHKRLRKTLDLIYGRKPQVKKQETNGLPKQ